ncbi:uncharacterized protein [Diadema setosum]|uniref:uncharacterized protein n=1 Tax=Diadema setosum TaxID=31175 RepID=UPI003B3A57AE
MAAVETRRAKNGGDNSRRQERPVTFAEFGLDLKPYFTEFKDHDRPSTFADFGVDVERERSTIDTLVGPYRKFSKLNREEKVFLVLCLLTILVTLGLTADRVAIVEKASDDFTFAILLLINILFCLYYVVHGVLGEHAYELIVFAFSMSVIFVYCITNFIETSEDSVKLARLVLVCIFFPFQIGFSIYMGVKYRRAKNLIFRTVGANIHLQDLCGNMYLFVDLLKVDLQLETSMVILVLDDGININGFEKIVLSLGLPLGLMWNILGFLALRYENRILVVLFLATGWILPAFITYKFIDLSMRWEQWPTKADKLLPTCIIVCGILGLIIRVFLVVVCVHLTMNFGQGLGEKVYGARKRTDTTDNLTNPPVVRRSRHRLLPNRSRPFSWPQFTLSSSRRQAQRFPLDRMAERSLSGAG